MKTKTPEAIRFPTQNYKSYKYPIRPLFTLALTIVLYALSAYGAIGLCWVLLAPLLSMDDLILTPLLRTIQSIKNIAHERKEGKAIVSLTAISLGLILGGVLGYFFLATMPAVALTLLGISTALQASIAFWAGTLLAATAATYACLAFTGSNIRLNVFERPLIGTALISASALILPALPVVVEAVVLGAIVTAFVSTIASKQLLRAYYKLRYGNSNADGYELTKNQTDLDDRLAQLYQVQSNDIKEIRAAAYEAQKQVKNSTSFVNEITGTRQQLKNAVKNIYHAITSTENKADVNEVIDPTLKSSITVMNKYPPIDTTGFKAYKINANDSTADYIPLVEKTRYNLKDHTTARLFHQQGLEAVRTKLQNSEQRLFTALQPFSRRK